MKNFIKSIKGEDRDWEVVTIPTKDIVDPTLFDAEYEFSSLNKPRNPKLVIYLNLIKDGVIFPPLVLDENNKLMDGTHRFTLYKYLKRKKVKVLRSLGKGTGQVKGNFKGRSTFPYKNIQRYSGHRCLICKELLIYKDGVVNASAFPQGLPIGKLHYCKNCGIIYKSNFVLWQK